MTDITLILPSRYGIMQCMSNLGEKIIELRNKKGITQAELARQLHFTPSTICKWEKNARTPSDSDIAVMAEFFGVPETYFDEGEPLKPDKRRRWFIIPAVIIVGLAACAVLVLFIIGRTRFVLLEEESGIGSYGEPTLELSYLQPKGCSEDRMDRFVKKRTGFLESNQTYDEYESFSLLFYESKEDYEQGETSLIHTTYRTDDVLE